MSETPRSDRPGDPEGGGYAEGERSPTPSPEEEHVGRFSEGQEDLPEDPHHGRFSEGQEELGEEDPEKHEERRFSEGQDSQPPGIVP